MAETAKILNPERIVVVPDMTPAARSPTAARRPLPRVEGEAPRRTYVVSYINCSAEVKAESDIICTSSNAEKIVALDPGRQEILFAPDKNLGRWLMKKTGRPMDLWQGSCIVHETFSEKKIVALKERTPTRSSSPTPSARSPCCARGLHRLDHRAAQVHHRSDPGRSTSSPPRPASCTR
jgi:quinolinate synthase